MRQLHSDAESPPKELEVSPPPAATVIMELPVDTELVLPALLFTLLAALAAAAAVWRKSEDPASSESTQRSRAACSNTPGEPAPSGASGPLGALTACRERKEPFLDKDTESQPTAHAVQDLKKNPFKSQQTTSGKKFETVAGKEEPVNSPSVTRMDGEVQPLRYLPGMLRTSQLEKMMSKEELEEEQRVQREQLAAIFKLLKENQETFGEVTEKDMEEQLKLYSI